MQKYKKILNNFLSQNKGFWPPKSKKKIQFSVKWLYNAYLTKLKSRTISLLKRTFTENIQTQILPKISDMSKIKV